VVGYKIKQGMSSKQVVHKQVDAATAMVKMAVCSDLVKANLLHKLSNSAKSGHTGA
jgi:hypothetical protein